MVVEVGTRERVLDLAEIEYMVTNGYPNPVLRLEIMKQNKYTNIFSKWLLGLRQADGYLASRVMTDSHHLQLRIFHMGGCHR